MLSLCVLHSALHVPAQAVESVGSGQGWGAFHIVPLLPAGTFYLNSALFMNLNHQLWPMNGGTIIDFQHARLTLLA